MASCLICPACPSCEPCEHIRIYLSLISTLAFFSQSPVIEPNLRTPPSGFPVPNGTHCAARQPAGWPDPLPARASNTPKSSLTLRQPPWRQRAASPHPPNAALVQQLPLVPPSPRGARVLEPVPHPRCAGQSVPLERGAVGLTH